MDDPTDFLAPVEWITLDEVRERYGPEAFQEIGLVEGFGIYRSGERESPEAAMLRIELEPIYADGQLIALVPPGYEPSIDDIRRSIDTMVRMTR